MYGDVGNDQLNGGAGADYLMGGVGNDRLDGGEGFDFAEYDLAAGAVTVNLAAGAAMGGDGSDTLRNIEGVTGSAFNDVITGSALGNTLDGRGGADILTGGQGNDAFSFTTQLAADNVDRIVDFTASQFDLIYLKADVFTSLSKLIGVEYTPLSADMFVTGTKAFDDNDHILYDEITGALFYDADGAGEGSAVQFATLDNKAKLSADSFFII